MKRKTLITCMVIASVVGICLSQQIRSSLAVSYQAGIKLGDSWTLGDFQGTCQAPCPQNYLDLLNITEATALVVGEPNGTTIVVKNVVAYSNNTVRTYATSGNIFSGTGNLSFVSSTIIASGLVPGDRIYNDNAAPLINGSGNQEYAGTNRTINILNDTTTHRVFQWDRLTGVLVSFTITQNMIHLSYQLIGTNLWTYRIAIYDANCPLGSYALCGYNPLSNSIVAGTTITFFDLGVQGHSVTSCTTSSPAPPCASSTYPPTALTFASRIVQPGTGWNVTLKIPGRYPFYDPQFQGMSGVIYAIGNATAPPSFNLTATPNPIIIPAGLTLPVTLSASASNGFTGGVTFNGFYPRGPNYPIANGPCCQTGFFYGGSGGFGEIFAISTTPFTPQKTYSALLIGTGNGLTRAINFTIIVTTSVLSFYLTPPTNTSIDAIPYQARSITITVHSVAGYAGTVNLLAASNRPAQLSVGLVESAVTLTSNGTANATLMLSGSPGNYTVMIQATSPNATLIYAVHLNVDVRNETGLLYYELFYVGTPVPGQAILLENIFSNRGNVALHVLSGTISGDLVTYSFRLEPPLLLQPGQTTSYNSSISLPNNARPGNHTIVVTIKWEAYFAGVWIQAPDLTIQGQLLIEMPPASHPLGPPTIFQRMIAIAASLTDNMNEGLKDYGLLAVILYLPYSGMVASLAILREQRRTRSSTRVVFQ